MATTRNFSVGPLAWTHVASGRADGEIVRLEGASPYSFAVTVGSRLIAPEIAPVSGHRAEGATDIPLVAMQQLWASAAAPAVLVVT
ncbi:hypothetical protein [Paracoccus shanxieyensis]|uniref:Uncharacterized protein n=1 Tax=Paracoccus shanxieyensis TaxID=2675752 RepID=A0A6L6IXW0_9RHOB|nr:hypothetical protein [Paracoccus shanxieyensis]MTH65063.1 hypothetical protein [Paracoccus shanxieyensis]MTH88207.1 hypothetical protein [Paracoccus shanxieyensis]